MCRGHEESSASPSIQTCTKSWRTVSCSTATITPPQAGHGGKQSSCSCVVELSKARVLPFTPHDLRRTFVGDLLEASMRSWSTISVCLQLHTDSLVEPHPQKLLLAK